MKDSISSPSENVFDQAYQLFANHSEYYMMATLLLYFKILYQDKKAFEAFYYSLLFSGFNKK